MWPVCDRLRTVWRRMDHVPRGLCAAIAVHACLGQAYICSLFTMNVFEPYLVPFVNGSFYAHYGVALGLHDFAWLWSLCVTSYAFGAIAGSMCMHSFLERFGRRDTIMRHAQVMNIVAMLLQALCAYANSFELLIVGRLLGGFAISIGSFYVLIVECAPDRYRGEAWALVNIGTYVWVVLSTGLAMPTMLGSADRWPIFMLVPVPFSIAYIGCTWLLPRSPKWLYITKGDRAQAVQAVYYYHGKSASIDDVLAEYDREAVVLDEAAEQGDSAGSSGADVTPTAAGGRTHIETMRDMMAQPALRKALAVCIVATVAQCFSGETVGTQYSTLLFESFGITAGGSVALLGALITMKIALGIVVSVVLIERVGRRPLLLAASASASVGLALVFLAGVAQPISGAISASTAIAVLGFVAIVIGDVLGLLSIPSLLVAELCAQASRSAVATVCATATQIFNLAQVFAFSPLFASIGAYTYLPNLVLELGSLAWLYGHLPETKSRPIDEIVRELAGGKHEEAEADVDKRQHSDGNVAPANADERTPLI